jgi:hypothetical protein
MELTQEHEGIRRNVKAFIDKEINPHVDEWEQAGIFRAHELFFCLSICREAQVRPLKPSTFGVARM